MWQPIPKQWRLIWPLAILILLSWPVDGGSLAVKGVRWLADPSGSLPQLPGSARDGSRRQRRCSCRARCRGGGVYRFVSTSGFARLRLRLKELNDPLDQSTERQLFVGIAVMGALGIWKLGGSVNSWSVHADRGPASGRGIPARRIAPPSIYSRYPVGRCGLAILAPPSGIQFLFNVGPTTRRRVPARFGRSRNQTSTQLENPLVRDYFVDFAAGCKVSFCTRQFCASPV